MTIRKYFWADRNTPLSYYYRLSNNVFPVLEPDDETRKARWSSVLQWYGLEEITPPAQELNATATSGYETDTIAPVKDIILVIGSDLLEPVTVYSRITGRSFLELKSVTELEEDSATFLVSAAESVLIVALPDCLTYTTLERITAKLNTLNPDIEWGVVTAPDPAGLSFVFAKMLTDSNRSLKEGVLDILHGYIYETDPTTGDIAKNKPNAALIQETVSADWRILAIVAHGEGAHANLESVVLCGIIGPNELDASGSVIPGCRTGACKRVHNPAVTIWPVRDLKNQISVFLSCNGFSVAKELYSSNLSFILSAAEGFTKAVITTTKCMPFDEHIPVLFLQLIQSGMSLGAIVKLVNSAGLFSNSLAPYILFGDPLFNRAASPNPLIQVNSSGKFEIEKPTRLVYLDLKKWPPQPVIEVVTADREMKTFAVIGSSKAALLNESPDLITGGHFINRTVEFKEHTVWLSGLLRDMERIRVLEQAINRYHHKDFETCPELKTLWTKICQIRFNLTEQIYRMLRILKRITGNHLWEARTIAAARQQIGELARLWESSFSMIVSQKLLSRSLYHLPHYYHFKTEHQKGPLCNRCGTATIQTLYCYPDDSIAQRRTVECPICGELSEHPENGVIAITLLNNAGPGQTAVFNVRCPDDTAAPPGILVGEVTDKSKGKVFYKIHQQGRIGPDGVNIKILLPTDVGYDLHAIKLAWIRALDVSYARFRFSVIITKSYQAE